jgi:polygalacturonase
MAFPRRLTTFPGLYCNGGHGLSIGSVGGRDDNTVKNVTFIDSQVVNSQNGVRIKTVYGATGSVSDVCLLSSLFFGCLTHLLDPAQITYSGITLSNVNKYGVVIEQDYENGSPTGKPTTGVPITNLKLNKVTGTVTSSAKDYYILCGSGACSSWAFSGVSVTGGKSNSCNYKPSGFSC